MMRVDTESTMPSSIRKERILCARSVSSATKKGSRKWIRVFIYSHWSDRADRLELKTILQRIGRVCRAALEASGDASLI